MRRRWSPASPVGQLPVDVGGEQVVWASHEAIYTWVHAQPDRPHGDMTYDGLPIIYRDISNDLPAQRRRGLPAGLGAHRSDPDADRVVRV